MKLTTKRLGRDWWIVGDEEYGPYGPYNNRVEAEEDRKGLKRSERYQNETGFVTSDKPQSKTNEEER